MQPMTRSKLPLQRCQPLKKSKKLIFSQKQFGHNYGLIMGSLIP